MNKFAKARKAVIRLPDGTLLCLTIVSLDPLTTYLFVNTGLTEGHPMWSTLIANFGIGPAMTIRLISGLVLVTAVAVAIQHDGNPLTSWVLRVLTGVFGAITTWNLIAWVTA